MNKKPLIDLYDAAELQVERLGWIERTISAALAENPALRKNRLLTLTRYLASDFLDFAEQERDLAEEALRTEGGES